MSLVVAAWPAWSEPETLARRTGRIVHLVTTEEDLTSERLRAWDAELVFLPHWPHRLPVDVCESFECVRFSCGDELSAWRCVSGTGAGPVYMTRAFEPLGDDADRRARDLMEEMMVEIVRQRPAPRSGTRRRPESGDLLRAGTLEEAYELIRMRDADGHSHAFLDFGEFRAELTDPELGEGEIVARVRVFRRGRRGSA